MAKHTITFTLSISAVNESGVSAGGSEGTRGGGWAYDGSLWSLLNNCYSRIVIDGKFLGRVELRCSVCLIIYTQLYWLSLLYSITFYTAISMINTCLVVWLWVGQWNQFSEWFIFLFYFFFREMEDYCYGFTLKMRNKNS
jgi:hypothetical protein